MTDLGTLGGTWSYALGINASGQIVGDSWINTTDSSPYHGYLYSGGVMTDLGTLPYGSDSQANGINASGQVVGSSYTLVGPHAFLYSGGVMTDLGTLPGDGQGYSKGINASGQVVGYSVSKDGSLYRAFLYSGGAMIDLNSLLPANSGWFRLTEAYAINDFGQIAGSGIVNGATHAFLLNLTSLSPSSATAGGAAFTLKVTGIGTNFVPGATVNWNGTVLATTYVSATEMTASVPASLIAAAGTASVAVTTNEGTLAGGTFAIYAPRALPGEPERPRGTMPREQR
jgi:probable HAF family extracellular repeat protein